MVELLRSIIVPIDPENWPSLEMLLEVADSSITYRSRYFTALQAVPVVDLLMNDVANPRSLAFQLKDLARHSSCAFRHAVWIGGWPVLKQTADGSGRIQAVECGPGIAVRGLEPGNQSNPAGQSARETWTAALPALLRGHLPTPISAMRKWSVRRETENVGMLYRVRHQTIYDYLQPVSVSHHVVRLTPRDLQRGKDALGPCDLYRFGRCRPITCHHPRRLLRQHRYLVYPARSRIPA